MPLENVDIMHVNNFTGKTKVWYGTSFGDQRYFPSLSQITLIGYRIIFSVRYMKSVSELDIPAFLGLDNGRTELLQGDINRSDALHYTPLHRC